ncbi:MAG: LptF/LptG family permease [Treponema sp.]|nr:LptF/LptG family permease [Treponema sp.]
MKITRLLEKIEGKIDYFFVKYLHRDQLKDHLLVRYLMKDLFLYFTVSFLFFFMIFFVNQILLDVERLLAQSAPFSSVVKIMFYSFPMIIAQSAPYATFVGFLMCLGGMMSNNEVLIYRAAGFSFLKIMMPVLLLGLIISFVSFFVNDYLLPLGTMKYNRLLREIMNAKPTVELESNSVKNLDGSTIVMGQVEDPQVSDIVLFDTASETDKIIVAGKSTLTGSDVEGVLMQLNMNDALVLSMNDTKHEDYDVLMAEKAQLNVFDSTVLGSSSISPREMTVWDLGKEISKMQSELDGSKSASNRLNIWKMEFHKKFSIPFGAFFFAFLAFSFAFLFGKHNGQTLGLLVGLIMSVLYWAMSITGQLFVQKLGLNSFICIWGANFVVAFAGFVFFIFLLRK